MNYKQFKAKGVNPVTGRKKTIVIDVPMNLTPQAVIASQNLINEPFEIEEIPFCEPSDAQIRYANGVGIKIPDGACDRDVSALLSRYEDNDSNPNPGLVEFATNRGLMFSQYIGKKALYDLVFYKLEAEDRIAFFCFSIYRYLSDDRHANLDTSPHREIFYSFARSYVNDARFVKSMNGYSGSGLRYFGNLNVNTGDSVFSTTGSSVNTIAYKEAAQYLHSILHTPLTKTKVIMGTPRNNCKKHNVPSLSAGKIPAWLFHLILFVFTVGIGNMIYLIIKNRKK